MENTTWTFGGVQMTEREHAVISAVSRRGTCPYCGRMGMTKKFGSQGKHMRACSTKFTLLEKEKMFAMWLSNSPVALDPATDKIIGTVRARLDAGGI